ncbi:MAG: Hsp70 family protein [Candidatus Melainabacteria bacterium]|nr:Hsp70 family protein [Candidatus Melainabacteria bacterium]
MSNEPEKLSAIALDEGLEDGVSASPGYRTLPRLQAGGPGSGLPPPFLVACGQSGHTIAGFDIGTRFSRLAALESGEFVMPVAPLSSTVSFVPGQAPRVGDPGSGPVECVAAFRHLIGTDWYVQSGQGFYNAEDLTCLILRNLKLYADSHFERPVSKAVLTVPSTFTARQRRLLRESAEGAGIEVLQLINEPTAAALYHFYNNYSKEGRYFLFHLGAGSFAVSVIDYYRGIIEVKGTRGRTGLGGNTMDDLLVEWMLRDFEDKHSVAPRRDRSVLGKFRLAAETIKEDLSLSARAHFRLTNIPTAKTGVSGLVEHDVHYIDSISLMDYQEIVGPSLAEMESYIDRLLDDLGMKVEDFDEVLVVGECARSAPVASMLVERFGVAELRVLSSGDAPVSGAAIMAILMANNVRELVVWDVLAEPVVVLDDQGEKTVLGSGSPVPVTGYHRCQSPDATINLTVYQGAGRCDGALAELAELTINNCPPTPSLDARVEFTIHAANDGIVDFSARHLGLAVNLQVSVREGERMPAPREVLPELYDFGIAERGYDERRLLRLARVLNLSGIETLNFLTGKGHSIASINSGRAIEAMLRQLKLSRRPKPPAR